MRTTRIVVSIIAILAPAALAQTTAEQNADHVFYFTHTEAAQDIQEIATVIRAIADLQNTTVDTAQKTLAVEGTQVQIGLAKWLFTELDKPAADQPAPDQVTHEYRVPGSSDDVVRLFYVPYAGTLQQFQEVATLVRSIGQIRRVFTYNSPRALAMRGSADQAAMSDWLIATLNVPAKERSAVHQLPLPGASGDVMRVFYLTTPLTVQAFQEVATVARGIGDIRFLFTYSEAKAIAMRGTPEQAALTEWLFRKLDKPASGQAVAQQNQDPAADQFSLSDREGVVRVFYLSDLPSVQRFQQVVTSVRTTTMIRRAFTYNTLKAATFRGTAEQMTLVDRMIREQDKP